MSDHEDDQGDDFSKVSKDSQHGESPDAPALTARERAKAWRKAAYQKAKVAHKERSAALKSSPAALARKEQQAEYRRTTYQKQKGRRLEQKAAAKAAADARDDRADATATQEAQDVTRPTMADLRLVLTTADQLPAKTRGLRLVRDGET